MEDRSGKVRDGRDEGNAVDPQTSGYTLSCGTCAG